MVPTVIPNVQPSAIKMDALLLAQGPTLQWPHGLGQWRQESLIYLINHYHNPACAFFLDLLQFSDWFIRQKRGIQWTHPQIDIIYLFIYIYIHTCKKKLQAPLCKSHVFFCAGLVFKFQLPDQPEAKPWKLARSPSDDILFSGSKDGGGTGGFFIGKSSNWGFPMETIHLHPDWPKHTFM